MDGVYEEEDWTQWFDLCKSDIKKPEQYGEVSGMSDTANPHILAYQNFDPTAESTIRIPLSVLRKSIMKFTDSGGYFESDTVDGALQELGAKLVGVKELLSQI